MSRRVGLNVAVIALVTAAITGGVAAAAQAARADDPVITFDTPTQTIEYGQGWYFQATVHNAPSADSYKATTATLGGAPSGYAPSFSGFQSNDTTYVAYVSAQDGAAALGPGTYAPSVTVTDQNGTGSMVFAAPPGSLTVTPAALGIALQITPDPSNPVNAIVSARFTGAFVDAYIPSSDPTAGKSPAGTWTITVTDGDGNKVHDFTVDRAAGDDVLGVSTYWSDVPPGQYTARATFAATGGGSANFTITQPDAVTFTPAPQPGATSTATPAPPAPPASPDAGTTLPGWIPIAAGALSAGLLALTIVQIVRLRRARADTGEAAA